MKKRRTIFTALIALLVLTMGVNFDAEAQLGGLLNKAKEKVSGGDKKKKAEQEALLKEVGIPQPDPNAGTYVFFLDKEGVCMYNPATLEISMTTTYGGNTPGAVYKIDPNTGNVTDQNGKSVGSMSNDGTIQTKNIGKIYLTNFLDPTNYSHKWKIVKDGKDSYDYFATVEVGGRVSARNNMLYLADAKALGEKTNLTPLLTAFIFAGLVTDEENFSMWKLNYNPCRAVKTADLEKQVSWKDAATEKMLLEYEMSYPKWEDVSKRPPELKNCKIGGIGIISGNWNKEPYKDNDGIERTKMHLLYWVVYELEDGRNLVAFNRCFKVPWYVENINGCVNERLNVVTDWQRK